MRQPVAALTAFTVFVMLVLGAVLSNGSAADEAHIAFQIATGTSDGAYFPVGQEIAGLISHPPGMDRCDVADLCGPSGLIISARSSQGAVDNLLEVNNGTVDSGLAQDDTIRDAVSGTGAFAKSGKLTHVRAIAALFAEDVHLVVAVKSGIAKVADLRGKRVSLGTDGSGVDVTAREILSAQRLPEWRLHAVHESTDVDVQMMQAGKLDAFFVVGGIPDLEIGDLIGHDVARLIPIDGKDRDRLIKAVPGLTPAVIPAGTYPNTGTLQTVATRAIWIVRDSASEALVYGITRALFQPDNRAALAASYPSAREISLAIAALDLPAPLHPGAARYYRQMGKLPKTN